MLFSGHVGSNCRQVAGCHQAGDAWLQCNVIVAMLACRGGDHRVLGAFAGAAERSAEPPQQPRFPAERAGRHILCSGGCRLRVSAICRSGSAAAALLHEHHRGKSQSLGRCSFIIDM